MSERVVDGLTNFQYRQEHGISKSSLDHMARSPAHYMASITSPPIPTADMAIGSAFHAMVLEPEGFDKLYAIAPEGIDRRTKEGKARWAEFEEIAKGKEILKANDYDMVRDMAQSVMSHPIARPLFTGGKAERSVFWDSALVEGVQCKCRPDYIKEMEDGYILVDLKSARDARSWAFTRAAWDLRYHVQSAYYWDGCTSVLGKAPQAFVFVAVEKTPPYAVAVYDASIDLMNAGREAYFADLRLYKQCLDEGSWPGYPVEMNTLNLPGWARKEEK